MQTASENSLDRLGQIVEENEIVVGKSVHLREKPFRYNNKFCTLKLNEDLQIIQNEADSQTKKFSSTLKKAKN